MIYLNVWRFISLPDRSRKKSFAFKIMNPDIYFISITKFGYSTTRHNIFSSFIWLYEFQILHAKILLENKVDSLEKASVSIWYITVSSLLDQNFFELVSTSSMFGTVYSFKNSKLLKNIFCIKYRRRIIIFV